MKLWIPGGRGMLGVDVADEARSRGVDVIVSGREVDVADAAAVDAFIKREQPTHIVNCAAHTGVDACESEEASAMRANAEGPSVLAAAAREHRVHLVHVSTDYVFAGDATRPYVEDDATGPLGVYGRSKLEGERRVLAASASGAAVVRTSWLYGVRGKCFPATMLRLMREREELRVVDDQRGRPTFTRDLARALVDVSERRFGGVFHFANTGDVSWHGFAVAIRDAARARGVELKVREVHAIPTSAYPTPAQRPAWSVLSTAKIEAALGWTPRPWAQALDAYLDELR